MIRTQKKTVERSDKKGYDREPEASGFLTRKYGIGRRQEEDARL